MRVMSDSSLGSRHIRSNRRRAKVATYITSVPEGGTLVRVTSDALGWESDSWPNGVVGTPDGKKLYVNKWYYDNKGGTWVFDIKRDGTLSNMRKFTDWGGDGMSMDGHVEADRDRRRRGRRMDDGGRAVETAASRTTCR